MTDKITNLVGDISEKNGRIKVLSHGDLNPALAQGVIEMTIPDKPNSRNQRYRRKQLDR